MSRRYFNVIAIVAALISCQRESLQQNEFTEYYLNVTTEFSDQTKTYIEESNFGYDIKWSEGDRLALYSPNSNSYAYSIKEGQGTTKAVFSTNVKPDFKDDDTYTAFYPASVVAHENGVRTLSWPDTQHRTLYHPEIVAMPLLAEGYIEDGSPSNATFNCLGGILDVILKVPEDGIAGYLRKVVVTTGEKISGPFTLATASEELLDSEGSPTGSHAEKKHAVIDSENGSNSITYILEGNNGLGMYVSKGDQTKHHLMISLPVSPEDGYSSFQLDFYDEYDVRISGVSSRNKIVIERGRVTTANVPFSHIYRPELTDADPVGKVGTLMGVEAVVVELNGVKRAMAMKNHGTTEARPGGARYTITDTPNIPPYLKDLVLENGWRFPTHEEWDAFSETYGQERIPWGDDWSYENLYAHVGETVVTMPGSNEDYYVCTNDYYGRVYSNYSLKCSYSELSKKYRNGPPCVKVRVRPFRDLPSFPEDDPDHEITADDPVGTIGMFKGRQAVVMELRGYKVAVATTNVGASVPEEDGGKFSFDAKAGQDQTCWDYRQIGLKDGWRVPTSQEWKAMMELFWNYDDDALTYNWGYSDVSKLTVKAGKYVTSETGYYVDLNESNNKSKAIMVTDFKPRDLLVRPIHSLEEIRGNSPVGTVGVVDGRECVVVGVEDGQGYLKKFLFTTNNPGPANGIISPDYQEGPNIPINYKLGLYISADEADILLSNGFFGEGWNLPDYDVFRKLLETNYNPDIDFYDDILHVHISDSYILNIYKGGSQIPGTYGSTTNFGYYWIHYAEGYGWLDIGAGTGHYSWSQVTDLGERADIKTPVCLCHQMPE